MQISTNGGTEPVWSAAGNELFYRTSGPSGPELVAARLELDTTLSVASRDALFPLGEIEGAEPHANYGIAPDGGFVMIRRTQLPKLVLIQNVDRALADRP